MGMSAYLDWVSSLKGPSKYSKELRAGLSSWLAMRTGVRWNTKGITGDLISATLLEVFATDPATAAGVFLKSLKPEPAAEPEAQPPAAQPEATERQQPAAQHCEVWGPLHSADPSLRWKPGRKEELDDTWNYVYNPSSSPNEVLALDIPSIGDINIKYACEINVKFERKDLSRVSLQLTDGWLNDDIINTYFSLLQVMMYLPVYCTIIILYLSKICHSYLFCHPYPSEAEHLPHAKEARLPAEQLLHEHLLHGGLVQHEAWARNFEVRDRFTLVILAT